MVRQMVLKLTTSPVMWMAASMDLRLVMAGQVSG
jgi:hypothetical protein